MKADVVIPDLPQGGRQRRQLGEAAVAVAAAASATAMLQLAREVAFVRLLDSGQPSARPTVGRPAGLRRLAGK